MDAKILKQRLLDHFSSTRKAGWRKYEVIDLVKEVYIIMLEEENEQRPDTISEG